MRPNSVNVVLWKMQRTRTYALLRTIHEFPTEWNLWQNSNGHTIDNMCKWTFTLFANILPYLCNLWCYYSAKCLYAQWNSDHDLQMRNDVAHHATHVPPIFLGNISLDCSAPQTHTTRRWNYRFTNCSTIHLYRYQFNVWKFNNLSFLETWCQLITISLTKNFYSIIVHDEETVDRMRPNNSKPILNKYFRRMCTSLLSIFRWLHGSGIWVYILL